MKYYFPNHKDIKSFQSLDVILSLERLLLKKNDTKPQMIGRIIALEHLSTYIPNGNLSNKGGIILMRVFWTLTAIVVMSFAHVSSLIVY